MKYPRSKHISSCIPLFVLLLSLVACRGEIPGPAPATPTRIPFPTSVPLTDTPIPSSTPTLRPSSTPLATMTLPPSLTPVPTDTPTPGIIGIGFETGPLRDDFSDPLSGWAVELNSDWGFGYYEGGYRIYNNMTFSDVGASRTRSHTDFVIEVDVHKLSGPDNAYFGVSCREMGINYYTLGITGNGEYSILKVTGGEIELLESGAHPIINKGNDVNHLAASCIGNVFTLSVNGVEVASIIDVGPLFGSFVGLVVGTTTIPGIEVKFDNFNSYPAEGAPLIPTLTLMPTTTPTLTITAAP